MKFYIDTANVDEIRRANDMGIIAGVTTNPSLIAKEGRDYAETLSAKGIPTNCTLIFSANQALLAARAGATYVSPFLGRLDDIGQPGIDLIETIHDIFLNYPDIETQIIAASVRNPIHVTDCALAGADIAGIEKFKADYTKVFGVNG